jgi:hypothetical protein
MLTVVLAHLFLNGPAPPTLAERMAATRQAQAEACKAAGLTRTATPTSPARNGPAPASKLGDLPPGALSHAVLRSVGGCPVIDVVRYDPSTGERRWITEPAGAAQPAQTEYRGPSRVVTNGFATPAPVDPAH